MRFSQFSGFRVQRTMGAPPMSDNSQYAGCCQPVGTTLGKQSCRAVGTAAATQRARVTFQRDLWVLKTALKSRRLRNDSAQSQDVHGVARGSEIRNQKVLIAPG